LLNRAVALAKVRGPAEALVSIAPLENNPKLHNYYPRNGITLYRLREEVAHTVQDERRKSPG
jgi:predicted RNA polymerase sigma factor